MLVNKRQLSEILGISEQTLTEWQAQGMPMTSRGARGEQNQYETVGVIRWWLERTKAELPESHRDRLARLQADKIELELGRERGEIVPVSEVAPVWQLRVLSAASYLSGQHSRLAGVLEATPGIEGKRELIRATVVQFLTHLGINGERMQAALEQLLAELPEGRRENFFREISEAAPVMNGGSDGIDG